MTVRTRFAPSPTGYMHIGGMRTALFNWLFARHHGGQFVLRIDDTDRQRNVAAAIGPILGAFRWLGLNWDEGPEVGGEFGPYFQSERGEFYRSATELLLASGRAYKCFETPEQIAADRESAQADKRLYLNSRWSAELSAEEVSQREADGATPVIRLLVPRDRKVAFRDAVRGDVEFDCGLMTDPVIVRADGSPLYNFATVVDDAALRISHVIRAEEHLSNTPIQFLLYEALGEEIPIFAHIPYVAAPGSKEKLSKRKLDKYRTNPQFRKMFEAAERVFPRIGLSNEEGLDPVMMEYYERIGYLPDAVFNALSRIGWSLDDKTEFMTRETVIEHFTLERVVKSPAGLDPDKLDNFQMHWMSGLSQDEKVSGCAPFLVQAGLLSGEPTSEQRDFIRTVVALLGDRLKLFSDILTADYFFKEELSDSDYDLKNLRKRLAKESVTEHLSALVTRWEHRTEWSASSLEADLCAYCEHEEIGTGMLIPVLRLSATGVSSGPELFPSLELIGQDRFLRRVARAMLLAASE